MHIPIPATLLVAAAILSLGGCSQEPPRLEEPPIATPREEPAAPRPPPPVQAGKPKPVQAVKPKAVQAGKAPAAAPSREKLGAGRCRTCHRLQYDSWVQSGHARKALDCEGCHGNGSEYARAEVMKDRSRALAAGLIFQTAAFCEKCHPTADASFLPKAHAHKAK